MTLELAIVLAVVVISLVLFITDALRVDIVAMLVLIALLLTGIISPAEGLQGFSNEATITIGAMFVLSEGLRRTGALNTLAKKLGLLFLYHYRLGLLVMMIGAAVVSAFINNVAVVAIMLPVMVGICHRIGLSPSRVLIPLSFAAMFGGACTLIGTSSNLLVSSLIAERGMEPIGMFEMTPVGLVLLAVGIIYLTTVSNKLLPDRDGTSSLEEKYELGEFRANVKLLPGDRALGEPASQFFSRDQTAQVLRIYRNGKTESDSPNDVILKAGDVLRISGSARAIHSLEKNRDLIVLPLDEMLPAPRSPELDELELFEVVITPDSSLVNRTLRQSDFKRYHPATIIAVWRSGQLVDDLMDITLHGGDILLLQAPRDCLERMQKHDDFLVISEIGLPPFKRHLIFPVIAILISVVAVAAIGWAPIVILAIAAAVLLVLIGALNTRDAYEAIDWQVIFFLGGFIPLGAALDKTGGIELIAGGLVGWLGGYGPFVMLGAFYFVTNILSDSISNQATAVLLTPVAATTAIAMGADPRPFVIAVAFAASDSFASPVGYHTNVMIYSAGNYRYLDFVKIGFPLNILFLIFAVIFIPLLWEF